MINQAAVLNTKILILSFFYNEKHWHVTPDFSPVNSCDKEMHLINHKGKQNNLSLMEIVFSRYRLCSIVHTEMAWLKTSKQQCTQPSITCYFFVL